MTFYGYAGSYNRMCVVHQSLIPQTHEDYRSFKYAAKVMSDLAEHVNAVKEDGFMLQTLEHVQVYE